MAKIWPCLGAATLFAGVMLEPISALAAIPSAGASRQELLAEIARAPLGGNFKKLMEEWTSSPSPSRGLRLAEIAQDTSQNERTRYIALMGAAHEPGTSGRAALEHAILRLSTDSSWVLRSAALEAMDHISAPGAISPELARISLRLLSDRALVVRSRAVDSVARLRPAGAREALVATALDPANHHGSKALWVPQKALKALASLPSTPESHAVTEKLSALLKPGRDPELAALVRKATKIR